MDYNSPEYQTYLKEERARRKAGLAAREFEQTSPSFIQDDASDMQEQSEPSPDLHKFVEYTYPDAGGSGVGGKGITDYSK